jgi:hypothetical protein
MTVTPCRARYNPLQNVGVDFTQFGEFEREKSGVLAPISSRDASFHAGFSEGVPYGLAIEGRQPVLICCHFSLRLAAGAPELASKHPYA